MTLKEQYWPYLAAMDTDVDAINAMIADSAHMNYLRWDVLGTPINKNGSKLADTFEDAVSNVKRWLSGREDAFTVLRENVVYTSVDNKTMDVYCNDSNVYTDVSFLIWGLKDGQNDIVEYPARRDENGCFANLTTRLLHGTSAKS